MLAIRMQRTGRKGHAMFRVVVQDSRLTPTSGRVVAQIGHYDPHTKAVELAKDKVEYYLQNGAQPSDRVVQLLQAQGIKLPDWVEPRSEKSRSIRNPDKLRKNQPKEEASVTEEHTESPAEPEQSPDGQEETPTEATATESEEKE